MTCIKFHNFSKHSTKWYQIIVNLQSNNALVRRLKSLFSPSKSSWVIGTPNSRLIEITMSAEGNREFLTTSFMTLEFMTWEKQQYSNYNKKKKNLKIIIFISSKFSKLTFLTFSTGNMQVKVFCLSWTLTLCVNVTFTWWRLSRPWKQGLGTISLTYSSGCCMIWLRGSCSLTRHRSTSSGPYSRSLKLRSELYSTRTSTGRKILY